MLTRIEQAGLTVRPADQDDDEVADVLAELDSAPALAGRRLLALADGWPVAAISLDDGRVVANPFTRSAEAVALLRLRASQLGATAERRPWPLRTWRRAQAAA
jgi:hypothetical protein